MRRILAIAAAASLLVLAGAVPATAQESVAFEAQLHHFTAPDPPCPPGEVCTSVSYGYAFTNIMGALVRVTVEFTWDRTTTPCETVDPLEFTLVGETGSITISGSAYVCAGPSGSPAFFTGTGTITDGTGEFSDISGSVTAEGIVGPNGPVLHMSGTVSY